MVGVMRETSISEDLPKREPTRLVLELAKSIAWLAFAKASKAVAFTEAMLKRRKEGRKKGRKRSNISMV